MSRVPGSADASEVQAAATDATSPGTSRRCPGRVLVLLQSLSKKGSTRGSLRPRRGVERVRLFLGPLAEPGLSALSALKGAEKAPLLRTAVRSPHSALLREKIDTALTSPHDLAPLLRPGRAKRSSAVLSRIFRAEPNFPCRISAPKENLAPPRRPLRLEAAQPSSGPGGYFWCHRLRSLEALQWRPQLSTGRHHPLGRPRP